MREGNLFENKLSEPLASRLRPCNLEEIVGQEHLLGEKKILRRLIEQDSISSMIFWGPPGSGKTTLANVIATKTKSNFIKFSAVISGIREIKDVMAKAEKLHDMGERTIVFIDEIHRFNKAQQDAFLPFVERGSIILIGATTENPSFELNGALLSRCKVFVLKPLTEGDMINLLKNALQSPNGFGDKKINISDEHLKFIAAYADGDARRALSALEMIILNSEITGDVIEVDSSIVEQCLSKKMLLYDKNGEQHYDLISALHKSMRNSDSDAAVYWLARMLEAGESPLYIARRIVRFASEDVGLAEPRALEMAVAAYQACHFIGMPECSTALTQIVVYLSLMPKSNALYLAYESAKKDALKNIAEPVPLHLRNAVTKLMKELDYGKGYQYAHDTEEKVAAMSCLPESLADVVYYKPTEQGFEKRFKDRLENIKNLKLKLSR